MSVQMKGGGSNEGQLKRQTSTKASLHFTSMALSLMSFSSKSSQLKLPHHHHHQQVRQHYKHLEDVKSFANSIKTTSISFSPLESLHKGNWFKLICGASFEDVVDVRNLSLVYALAGVDCIDCAADAAVVSAVNEGIEAARGIVDVCRPWVMISVNDDEDLHFRKAEFDPEDCPPDCSRPCERVCPADAISLGSLDNVSQSKEQVGVITERCYGCGRCFPVCPYDKIRPATYVRDVATTSELLKRTDVDAIEIHTSGRNTDVFKKLWNSLGDSIAHVKLVAVSLPDLGDSTISSMYNMYSTMEPHLHCCNLWQLDGRPMSGDIGQGATREAIKFGIRLASLVDRPSGFLQLAGGTNFHTIDGLKKAKIFQTTSLVENWNGEKSAVKSTCTASALIGGVAYGGYARKIVGRVLNKMQLEHGLTHLEEHPEYLLEALKEAVNLVRTIKCYTLSSHLL